MSELFAPLRGTPLEAQRNRVDAFFNEITQLGVMIGEVTPESVVDARMGRFYFDKEAQKLYIKGTDLGTLTGWVALN